MRRVLFALLLAGHAQAADVWRFGEVEAKGDAGILFMPAKFGPKYGLDIQMVEFASSTTPIKALISGSLDAFTATPSVALAAMAQGAKLKFIGCNWPGATYTLYGAPGLKAVADLKGQSIGVSGPGSMPDLFARVALDHAHVPAGAVVFANAGGGADRFRALIAGVVKATSSSSEFEPEAEKRGLTILARARDIAPNLMRNCIVTTDKLIATRPGDVARFLAANIEGTAYALAHRDETIALSHSVAKLSPDDRGPAFIFDEAIAQHAIDPAMAVSPDKLQWLEDLLAATDVIDASQDVHALIDDAPRQAALKLVHEGASEGANGAR